MQANMGSEYWKKKVLLVRNRNINKLMIPAVTSVFGVAMFLAVFLTLFSILFSPVASAESALDDVTMRVIGLDEIPSSSLRIIEIPQPDLGEFADINESFVSPTQQQLTTPEGDAVTTIPDDGSMSSQQ